MLAQRFRDRAEDDAGLAQRVFESGDDGDAIEHRVHRHGGCALFDASEILLFLQRDAEARIHLEEFGINVGKILRPLG